jgi:hypothetical protein
MFELDFAAMTADDPIDIVTPARQEPMDYSTR